MTAPPGARITVRAIAAGGDGVATLGDGRTVFVPRTAPGDQVVLRNIRLHARYARAEIAEVLEPGPDRVMPPCAHYVADRCGSCQLMHLAPAAQRSVKGRVVGDAFRRIAHLDVEDPGVTAAPAEFGYRSKVTFTLQDGRIGYHRVNDPERVFEVHECLIAEPDIRALHAAVSAARMHLPSNGTRLVLRIDKARGRHVLVSTAAGNAWTGGPALHRALEAAGQPAVVWWQPESGQARAVAGAATPWPVTVFEQVNPAMGDLVRGAAIDARGAVRGRAVWDLYAGIGESSAALAARGAVVDSVERDARAVRLAAAIWPVGPRRHVGLVEQVVSTLPGPDIVLANPPRVGMVAEAADLVLRSRADRIVYISCDPATLARDVARLSPGYRVAGLQAFDQFPQTAHVECVATLERR